MRLRVEISTPEGGSYDCENPQRFSNRFVGKVANVNDVVQFYRKKKNTTTRKKDDEIDEAAMSQLSTLDTVKVEQLVREFLAAQSLTILPQNSFGDAVAQFIDKDDKHAMEMFVNESLESQVKHLMSLDREGDEMDDEELARSSIQKAMEKYRTQMEEMFSRGVKKRSTRGKKRFKPKPDGWDTEFDGEWEDQPGALIHSDNEVGDPNEEEAAEDGTELQTASSTRGRGRGRGGRAAAATTSRTTAKASAVKKSTSATTTRSRKQQVISDEEDDDVVMLDDDEEDAAPQALSNIEEDEDDDDDSQALFVKQPTTRTRKPASSSVATRPHRSGRSAASPAPSSATISGTATGRTSGRARQRQTTLNFVGSQSSTRSRAAEPSRPASKTSRSTRAASVASEDIDDDSDAFEPMQTSRRRR